MEWQVILALVLAIPIVLFPVAYVWYLNVGGIYAAIQEARKRRPAKAQPHTKSRVMKDFHMVEDSGHYVRKQRY